MRILLAQLTPTFADVRANVGRVVSTVAGRKVDLAVFPELFLTGYRIGDRIHTVALRAESPALEPLRNLARTDHVALVVGTPLQASSRKGEVENVALGVGVDGGLHQQVKRYLPTYGPFEEGRYFTPTQSSAPLPLAGRSVGVEICYDAFFPEVARELALAGAELLVNISASPVTSKRLFEKVLPARAVENAIPVAYVNRVGVEEGLVFGGGSAAWDARGEPVELVPEPFDSVEPEEAVLIAEVDLDAASRWRPFRPVLRDVATRRPAASSRATDSTIHQLETSP